MQLVELPTELLELILDHVSQPAGTSSFSPRHLDALSCTCSRIRDICVPRILRRISWTPEKADIFLPIHYWNLIESICLDLKGAAMSVSDRLVRILPNLENLSRLALQNVPSGSYNKLLEAVMASPAITTLEFKDCPMPKPTPEGVVLPAGLRELRYVGFGRHDVRLPGTKLDDIFFVDGKMVTNMMLSIVQQTSDHLTSLQMEGNFMCFEYLAFMPFSNLQELCIYNRPLALTRRPKMLPIDILASLPSLKKFSLHYHALQNHPYVLYPGRLKRRGYQLPQLEEFHLDNLFHDDHVLDSLTTNLRSLSILSFPRRTLWGPVIAPPDVDNFIDMIQRSMLSENLTTLRFALSGPITRGFMQYISTSFPLLETLEIQRCSQGMGGLERFLLEPEQPEDFGAGFQGLRHLNQLLLDIGHIDDKYYPMHDLGLASHEDTARRWALTIVKDMPWLKQFAIPLLMNFKVHYWMMFNLTRLADGSFEAIMDPDCVNKYRITTITVFQEQRKDEKMKEKERKREMEELEKERQAAEEDVDSTFAKPWKGKERMVDPPMHSPTPTFPAQSSSRPRTTIRLKHHDVEEIPRPSSAASTRSNSSTSSTETVRPQ